MFGFKRIRCFRAKGRTLTFSEVMLRAIIRTELYRITEKLMSTLNDAVVGVQTLTDEISAVGVAVGTLQSDSTIVKDSLSTIKQIVVDLKANQAPSQETIDALNLAIVNAQNAATNISTGVANAEQAVTESKTIEGEITSL